MRCFISYRVVTIRRGFSITIWRRTSASWRIQYTMLCFIINPPPPHLVWVIYEEQCCWKETALQIMNGGMVVITMYIHFILRYFLVKLYGRLILNND